MEGKEFRMTFIRHSDGRWESGDTYEIKLVPHLYVVGISVKVPVLKERP